MENSNIDTCECFRAENYFHRLPVWYCIKVTVSHRAPPSGYRYLPLDLTAARESAMSLIRGIVSAKHTQAMMVLKKKSTYYVATFLLGPVNDCPS